MFFLPDWIQVRIQVVTSFTEEFPVYDKLKTYLEQVNKKVALKPFAQGFFYSLHQNTSKPTSSTSK